MYDGRLDDKQIERLEDILEKHAIPNGGFTLESLDGYLSALVVSPERIMPSEWLPTVWGDKQPEWSSQQESFEVNELLVMHWNRCVALAQLGHKLPDDLFPLLMLPENPESSHPDSTIIGTLWAMGFIQGTKLRLDAWLECLGKEKWITEIFSLMLELSTGEKITGKKTKKPKPISYNDRLDIIAEIPGMIADLNQYRLANLPPFEPVRREATPERNDPCPCGSGRKYKKCCGAVVLH